MSKALRDAGIKDNEHSKVARFCEVKNFGHTLTSQAFADEVNINKIMDKIQKGQTVMTSSGEPFYGDVSELGGLHDAILKVQEAEDLFMQYPANIREKFENDPVQLIEFLENEANYDEALKLGLVNPKPVVVTPPVPEPGVVPKP